MGTFRRAVSCFFRGCFCRRPYRNSRKTNRPCPQLLWSEALVLQGVSHGWPCALEMIPSGSRHSALLCRSGAQSFRSAKPQRVSQPESIPSHCRSEVTGWGFPAFGRILLNGSRPALQAGNPSGMESIEWAAPATFLLHVSVQIVTSCCIVKAK